MVFFVGFLIFVVVNSACWFVSVSLLRSTIDDSNPCEASSYRLTAAIAVGAATLASFVQFPAGYYLRLVIWAIVSYGWLGLKPIQATVLFVYLAASSFLSGFLLLGIMNFFNR